jgi:hypothetical protein
VATAVFCIEGFLPLVFFSVEKRIRKINRTQPVAMVTLPTQEGSEQAHLAALWGDNG